MKLPFDFGPKLVFRLGIPGMILAAATAPLVLALGRSRGAEIDRLEIVAIGTVFWGWAVNVADMPIYMLYEGRRFWPEAARAWFIGREDRRLRDLLTLNREDVRRSDQRLYMESAIEVLHFPIDKDTGERVARFPTRLGNLIAAYETHTRIAYGLDAIFYWPRLWVVLDKDLREEADNQQAIADSATYTSLALWISSGLCLVYAGLGSLSGRILVGSPKPFGFLLLSIVSGVAAFAVYRTSLFAHAQFGELFKAIFDQHKGKLAFDDVVEKVGSVTGDPDAAKRSAAERYQIVARYLRWHRIRPPSETRNFSPEAWKDEVRRREDARRQGP